MNMTESIKRSLSMITNTEVSSSLKKKQAFEPREEHYVGGENSWNRPPLDPINESTPICE